MADRAPVDLNHLLARVGSGLVVDRLDVDRAQSNVRHLLDTGAEVVRADGAGELTDELMKRFAAAITACGVRP